MHEILEFLLLASSHYVFVCDLLALKKILRIDIRYIFSLLFMLLFIIHLNIDTFLASKVTWHVIEPSEDLARKKNVGACWPSSYCHRGVGNFEE